MVVMVVMMVVVAFALCLIFMMIATALFRQVLHHKIDAYPNEKESDNPSCPFADILCLGVEFVDVSQTERQYPSQNHDG